MGYSSPALTCVKASRRKAGASVFVLLVNGGRTSSRQQPVASVSLKKRFIIPAAQPEVVAIGECGLDFNRNFSTPEEQERAFVAQLRIAADLNMPVFMHCRDAHERFMTLLEPWLDKLPGAVLHCFTGTREEMQACVAHGIYIGITGWVCDERRGLELRELLPLIPAEKLLKSCIFWIAKSISSAIVRNIARTKTIRSLYPIRTASCCGQGRSKRFVFPAHVVLKCC